MTEWSEECKRCERCEGCDIYVTPLTQRSDERNVMDVSWLVVGVL